MQIHPSAVIDPSAQIGADCVIGPGAIVEANVVIGEGCKIGPHALVGQHTQMGAGNELHIGAVVGHLPQDLKYDPNWVSYTIIGERNVFREYCVIHRSASEGGATRIGNENYVMNHGHLGHDTVLGNNVIIGAGALLGGHVTIDDRAFISGNCAIHQFCRVGRIAMMRGLSGISMDIPPFCIGDFRNSLRGLNMVGLQRAGFDADTRTALKESFKMLFRSGTPLLEAAREVDATPFGEIPAVQELLDFCRTSKRGIVSWNNHLNETGTAVSDDRWLRGKDPFSY